MFRAEDWTFFNYDLPDHRIAARPVWYESPERGGSKLLHFSLKDSKPHIEDRTFSDILHLVSPGDLLILNNTKVVNARFVFELKGKQSEILLCRKADEESWYCLSRPMRNFEIGQVYQISKSLYANILGYSDDKRYLRTQILTKNSDSEYVQASFELIHEEGLVPIPPYIRKGLSDTKDKEDYQTVYAAHFGSVAAPTAGLHFSNEILETLKKNEVQVSFVTLHVGPASFLPIHDPEAHRPMTETYYISENLWEQIAKTRARGNKVIAVGTTVIRALESFSKIEDKKTAFDKPQETNLFITPGYTFDVVSSCFTNFHQPKSTHILLIAALIGVENLEIVYKHALNNEYRFLSYGDSSFLDLG